MEESFNWKGNLFCTHNSGDGKKVKTDSFVPPLFSFCNFCKAKQITTNWSYPAHEPKYNKIWFSIQDSRAEVCNNKTVNRV